MPEPMPSAILPDRPFYTQTFWRLVVAVGLGFSAAVIAIVASDVPRSEIHPAINALLNGSGVVFMVVGYAAIRRRDIDLHKRCMIAAVSASLIFLVSYVVRFSMSGSHRYPGDGVDKIIYLCILFSHMILATVALPMVLRTAYLGLRNRLARHRRLARIALPIWLYVSITGVIVYLMLYPLAKYLYG